MSSKTKTNEGSIEALYQALTIIFLTTICLLAALGTLGGDRMSEALQPDFGFHPISFVLFVLVISVSGKRQGMGWGYFPKAVWDYAAWTITVLLLFLTLLRGYEHFTGGVLAWLEPILGAPGSDSYTSFWTLAGLTALHALDVHCPRNPARYLRWMNYALFFSVASLCLHHLSDFFQGHRHEDGHLYFEGLSAISAAWLIAFAAYIFQRTAACKMLFDPCAPKANIASAAALMLVFGQLTFLEAFFPRPGLSLTLSGLLLLALPILIALFRPLEIEARIARGEIREDGTSLLFVPAPRSLDALLSPRTDRNALERGITSLFFARNDWKHYGVQAGLAFLLAYGAILLSRTTENDITMIWWANLYLAFNIVIAKNGQYLKVITAFAVALLAANLLAGNPVLASAVHTGTNATEGALIGMIGYAVFGISNNGVTLTLSKSLTVPRLVVVTGISLVIIALIATMNSVLISLVSGVGVFDNFAPWLLGSVLGMFSLMPLLIGLILEVALRYENLTPKIVYLAPLCIFYALGVFGFYAFAPTTDPFTVPHMAFMLLSLPLLVLPSLSLAGGFILLNSIVYYHFVYTRWIGDGPTIQINFLMMLIPSLITVGFMARHHIARRYKVEQRALYFAPNALITLDDDGHVLSISKNAREWFDVDDATLYGKRILGFFENSKELAERVEDYFQKNPAGAFELTGKRRLSSGQELVLAGSIRGNQDASLPYSYVVSLLDITKEHELEKEKNEVNEIVDAFLNEGVSYFFIEDSSYKTLGISKSAAKDFFNKSSSEVIGTDSSILSGEDISAVEKRRAIEKEELDINGKITVDYVRELFNHVGPRNLRCNIKRINRSNGDYMNAIVANDITDLVEQRVSAERALKASETYLRAGTNSFTLSDENFRVVFISEEFERRFGSPSNYADSTSFILNMFIDWDEKKLNIIRNSIIKERTYKKFTREYTERVRCLDGSINYVRLARRWIDSPAGDGRMLWTSYEDVTAIERARQAADQYLKAGVNPYAIQDVNFNTIFATESALAFVEARSVDEMNDHKAFYPDLSPKQRREYFHELKSLPDGEIVRTSDPIRILTVKNNTKHVYRTQRWFRGMDGQRLLVTAFEDVSELHAKTIELERAYNNAESILSAGTTAYIIQDEKFKCTFASEMFLALLGYTNTEDLPDISEIFVNLDLGEVKKYRNKLLNLPTGEVWISTKANTLICKDGSLRKVKVARRWFDSPTGRGRLMWTSVEDVTDLESALNGANAFLQGQLAAVAIQKEDFSFFFASEELCKMMGLSSIEDFEDPALGFWESPSTEKILENRKLMLALPTGCVHEPDEPWVFVKDTGERIFVKIKFKWIDNPIGQGRLLMSSIENITEIILREKELEEQRRSAEELLNAGTNAYTVLDETFSLVKCSAPALLLLGWQSQNEIDNLFSHIHLPDDDERQAIFKTLNELPTGEVMDFEKPFTIIRLDGTTRLVRASSRWFSNPTGSGRLLWTSLDDITDLVAARSFNEALLDKSPAIILTENKDFKIQSCSEAWVLLMGYSREETLGREFVEFFVPKQRDVVRRKRSKFRDGTIDENNFSADLFNKHGDILHIRINARVDTSGGGWRIILTVTDVTELEQQRRYTETLLNRNSSIILTQDENWKILSCSQAWIDQLGYSRKETVGHDLLEFMHPEDRETDRHLREATLRRQQNAGVVKNTLRLMTKAGVTRTIEIQSVADEVDGKWRNILTLVDLTEIMQTQEKLAHMVEHDELTGLLSRRGMERRFAGNTRVEDMALYLLDIDYFKSVNDSFGHDAGDALLCALGQTMRKLSDKDGEAIRLGGEEFAIIRRWHSWDEANSFGERLRRALQQTEVNWNSRDIKRTASIGFAQLQIGDRLSDVLHLADIVAREAKKTGRNKVLGATKSMMANLRKRGVFIRADEIQAALEKGEMHYEVQPIWNMQRHAIEGFEALIRWDKPDGTRVAPELFIDLFSQVVREPKYFELKSRMRRDCLAKLSVVPTQYVSFNYTLEQLGYEGAAQDVIETLESVKDHARREIVIEVSERAITARVDHAVLHRELTALQDAGYKIALDDFGVESSNLNRLQELPISIVKIDKALIANLDTSEIQRATLEGLSIMLNTMKIKIIVEGVATGRQAEILFSSGLYIQQGYLHARPMPPEGVAPNLATIGKTTISSE